MRDLAQRKVKVGRERLLRALRSNLLDHKEDFEEAKAAYKEKAHVRLTEALVKAENQLKKTAERARDIIDNEEPVEYILLVHECEAKLPAPKDYSSVYESAIDVMEWETEDIVELSHGEFECFVRDNWDWKEEFGEVSTALGLRKHK